MKVTIQQKELQRCLQAVSRSITKQRGTLPRSRAVHISRKDGGKLKVAAADGTASRITVRPEAKVHGDGEMLIPYSLLNRIVPMFDGELTLASKGPLSQDLSITESGADEEYAMGGRLGLFGEDPQHFPAPLKLTPNLVAEFTAPALRDIMRYAGFTGAQRTMAAPCSLGCSSSSTMTGWKSSGQTGSAWPDSNSRYPRRRAPGTSRTKTATRRFVIIIPVAVLLRSLQVLPRGNHRGAADDQRRSGLRALQLRRHNRGYRHNLRRSYPKYQELFPESFGAKIVLDGKRFRQLMQQAAVVADDSSHIVRLKADTDTMSVTAHAESISDYKGQMPAELTISDKKVETRVAFNSTYLNDFLALNGQPGQGGQVILDMSGPSNPTLLSFSGRDSYQYLIMPMFVHVGSGMNTLRMIWSVLFDRHQVVSVRICNGGSLIEWSVCDGCLRFLAFEEPEEFEQMVAGVRDALDTAERARIAGL